MHEHRQVSFRDGKVIPRSPASSSLTPSQTCADTFSMKFVETSAKTAANVGEAFETLISQAMPLSRMLFEPLSPSLHGPAESERAPSHRIEEFCPTFDDDVESCRPMIYKDLGPLLVRSAPLLCDLTLLRNRFGHKTVPVSLLENSFAGPPFDRTDMTLAEYLDRLAATQPSSLPNSPSSSALSSLSSRPGRPSPASSSHGPVLLYLQQVNMEKHLPEMLADFKIPAKAPLLLAHRKELIAEEDCHGPTFFVGMRGVKTSLHFDRLRGKTILSPPRNEPPAKKNPVALPLPLSLPLPQLSLPLPHFYPTQTPHSSGTPHFLHGHHAHSPHHHSRHQHKTKPPEDPGKYNLFVQLSGKRKFVLFSPEYSADLLPDRSSAWPNVSKSTTFLHSIPRHSPILAEQLEFIRRSEFPSLSTAWFHRQEYVLTHGDVFLIPPRWWYYSEVLETGTALNWWFCKATEGQLSSRSHEIGSPPSLQQTPPPAPPLLELPGKSPPPPPAQPESGKKEQEKVEKEGEEEKEHDPDSSREERCLVS
jgi:hypothetical protein